MLISTYNLNFSVLWWEEKEFRIRCKNVSIIISFHSHHFFPKSSFLSIIIFSHNHHFYPKSFLSKIIISSKCRSNKHNSLHKQTQFNVIYYLLQHIASICNNCNILQVFCNNCSILQVFAAIAIFCKYLQQLQYIASICNNSNFISTCNIF